jgi:hypothetical protein
MARKHFLLAPAALLLVLTATALVACNDDDGDGGGAPSGSVSASGEAAGPGVVTTKPADAAQIDVVLREWAVQPAQTTVRPGQVYFLVDNQGPEDPHEFVIIKTDLAPTALPFENNLVPENRVDIIDEIEPFSPRSRASITVNLTAGNYALICNITELEAGQVEPLPPRHGDGVPCAVNPPTEPAARL